MRHLRLALILPAALALGACAQLGMGDDRSAAAPEFAPVIPGRVTSSNPSPAQAVSGTDAAAAAARDAAGAGPQVGGPQVASGALGTTTASLGEASQGGLWLKTPLVRAPRSGRVVDVASGRSTDVELLPLGGPATGGSQISPGTMHALGLDPTELPELQVFGA